MNDSKTHKTICNRLAGDFLLQWIMQNHIWILPVIASMVAAATSVQAFVAKPGDVLINEIAWMGTASSSTHEWVELKNTTNTPIDLSGWILRTADKKINVPLQGEISAHAFYLLERTSDDTVPNVPADLIYKGSLSNKGQDLALYDNHSTTVDEVDFTANWPAGDNKTKQTMERAADGSWHTSIASGGTPKAENDIDAVAPIATPPPTPSPVPYPAGIIISELLPAPVGPAASDEWIELSNTSGAAADISGWLVQDTQGVTKTYPIPKNTIIKADSYITLKRPDTGIVLNDESDGVKLLTPDNAVVDLVSYQKAPRGESYALINGNWQWSSNPTPGSKNEAGVAPGAQLPSRKKPDNTEGAGATAIAAASAPEILFSNSRTQSDASPWFLVIAIGAAIIIAGATLLIISHKRKYNRPVA